MIKINKCNCPDVLEKNKTIWTDELLEAVNRYNKYSKIPKDEREKFCKHYRLNEVKEALLDSSYHKCAYCESKLGSSGYMQVEHFRPKSIYPELTFEWNNLLPVCNKCNISKLNHDTGIEPIINPELEDPEEYLTYSVCRITSKEKNNTKANKTIEVCDLNRYDLMRERSRIMLAISEYQDELEKTLQSIEDSTSDDMHRKMIVLENSINKISGLFQPQEAYSGFCKYIVNTSNEYMRAKKIIEEYHKSIEENF